MPQIKVLNILSIRIRGEGNGLSVGAEDLVYDSATEELLPEFGDK